MQIFSIAISNKLNIDEKALMSVLKNLPDKGVRIGITSSVFKDLAYYELRLEDRLPFIKMSDEREIIAEAISDIIVNKAMGWIIGKVIEKYYYYFDHKEKEEIKKIAYGILEREENIATFKKIKKDEISRKVRDFIEETSHIDIEGFINFRLKNFIGEIGEVVDKAVDEFLMQKEYNEFVGLLKYFVELQDSKLEVLNVVVDKTGKFHLYNEDYELLSSEYIKEMTGELQEGIVTDEDALMSILITIAPKKILFHSSSYLKNKEILDTIKKVFADRVEIVCSEVKCEK
ncbi:putative sporulation protein YtxC [Caldanaerobacter sp.]|uniref:putative sporulation protein YtxC n=1 Tax=Caldanaerobacter sp. TaxID=2930036 RepID=UPI003C71525D